ncbi:MAG: CocE/NonD family hydrolase [Actinobacteria bacterium]|nr:CocE/NonD family hydrolase [Actinomycetota bacterium]
MVAAAVAVVALGAIGPGAVAHDGPDLEVRPITFEVVDGPADDQRVRLDATVYVPSGATSTPAPVVVLAHGFGGDKDDLEALARQTAHHGYVALAYSARGFGRSTGAIGLNSLDYDVKDVRQIVDALADMPEVALDGPGDPRIGLTGSSYGGGIALMAATQDPRIDAIAPRITWSSLAYSLAPNDLAASPDASDLGVDLAPGGVLKDQWLRIFFGIGSLQPFGDVREPAALARLVGRPTCAGFVPEVCRAYVASVVAGEPTPSMRAVLERSSPSAFLHDLDAATFLVQGQDDTLFNLAESARTYSAALDNGAPAKLLWHRGGHSGPFAPGEVDVGLDPDDVVNSRILTWWDRWLADDPAADTGPGFETFLGHDGDGPVYASAPSFPPLADATRYLSGDGMVVGSPTDVVAGRSSFVTPALGLPAAYSETAGLQRGLPVPAFDLPGQHVAWETEPFDADTTLVGVPRLVDLDVSTTSGAAWFFAKLYDVGPDGVATLIRRQVSPVRADDLSAPIDVVLPGVSEVVAAGHRLRVVLAATDAAYANRRLPDTTTITVDPERPPRLLLPIGQLDVLAQTPS